HGDPLVRHDLAPQDKKSQGYAVDLPISLQPPTSLATTVNTFHDREHRATHGPKCSRSRGMLFTLAWNRCSPPRGNPVHDRVEYAFPRATLLSPHQRP